MRIYTEVNFQWDDKKGKLVELSFESFNYHGDLVLLQDAHEEGERIVVKSYLRIKRGKKALWSVWEYQDGKWVDQNETYDDPNDIPSNLTTYETGDSPVDKQIPEEQEQEESYIEQIEQGD